MTKFDYDAYYSYIKGSSIDNQKHIEYLKNRELKYINQRDYELIGEKDYEDGYAIPMDKVINILRSNDKSIDVISLYDLLKKGNRFRDSSLHEFFKKNRATSLQKSIDWLASKECAVSDSTTSDQSTGEPPSAYYYEDLDRYFIVTGQNRAFAGLLVDAENYRVKSISRYRRKDSKTDVEIIGQSIRNEKDKNKKSLLSKFKNLR